MPPGLQIFPNQQYGSQISGRSSEFSSIKETGSLEDPITSYGHQIYSQETHSPRNGNSRPQYIPLDYTVQGLPLESPVSSFKLQPVKLPPGVLTKEMIGPYPLEIANILYGVTMMNPKMMFSKITEKTL